MSILRLTEQPQEIRLKHHASEAEPSASSRYPGKTDFKYSIESRNPQNGKWEWGTLYLAEKAHKYMCELNPFPGSVVVCQQMKDSRNHWDYSFWQNDDYSGRAQNEWPGEPGANQQAKSEGRAWIDHTTPAQAHTQTRGANALAPQPVPTPRQQIEARAEARPLNRPESKLMAQAFMSALEALAAAKDYAEQKGLCFDYRSEDVRATALSMYINAAKGAR